MRIVLDTNILVRAHAKARGPARELLQFIIRSPKHILLLSPFLLQELERVFSYERVRASTKLTNEEIDEYLGCFLRQRRSQRSFFLARLPASCRTTPTTTPSFTLPL